MGLKRIWQEGANDNSTRVVNALSKVLQMGGQTSPQPLPSGSGEGNWRGYSYRAKYSQAVKKTLKIQIMPWSPQSPDRNPIENPWCIMKARINKSQPPVSIKEDLTEALQEV